MSPSQSVRYLTHIDVFLIHNAVIRETGGAEGVRDEESLKAAVVRPQTGIGDQEFFPDLFTKAAALLEALIQRHAFVDGNKRTGMTAMGVFLRLNGWEFDAAPQDIEDFAVYVAVSKPSIDEIAAWIRDNSKPSH